jgi:hypothetical protein
MAMRWLLPLRLFLLLLLSRLLRLFLPRPSRLLWLLLLPFCLGLSRDRDQFA